MRFETAFRGKVRHLFRVARASRVLVLASRRNGLRCSRPPFPPRLHSRAILQVRRGETPRPARQRHALPGKTTPAAFPPLRLTGWYRGPTRDAKCMTRSRQQPLARGNTATSRQSAYVTFARHGRDMSLPCPGTTQRDHFYLIGPPSDRTLLRTRLRCAEPVRLH